MEELMQIICIVYEHACHFWNNHLTRCICTRSSNFEIARSNIELALSKKEMRKKAHDIDAVDCITAFLWLEKERFQSPIKI